MEGKPVAITSEMDANRDGCFRIMDQSINWLTQLL